MEAGTICQSHCIQENMISFSWQLRLKKSTASFPFSNQTHVLAWGRTLSTLKNEAEAKLGSLQFTHWWGLETGMKIDP